MSPPLVFLDANALYSAVLGGPAYHLVLTLVRDGAIRPATSDECIREAATNLMRKRPGALATLDDLVAAATVTGEPEAEHLAWAAELAPVEAMPVLAAARAAGADVLLTADTTHFGPLMERTDLGLRVRTPRAFLLEGPA